MRQLLLALDGWLKRKTYREIGIDIYDAGRIAAEWSSGGALQSRVRRRVKRSRQLMEGGYRKLVTGG